MNKINEGDLFYIELSRISGMILVNNNNLDEFIDSEFNEVEDDLLLGFRYHMELRSGLIENTPDYDTIATDDDRKIILKYLGNGEFEEQASHEKMTMQTFFYHDPIWEELGVYDTNLKRLDGIVYDNPEPIKEQVAYLRKNPLVFWVENGKEDLRPVSELNQEVYQKYSDEYRVAAIKKAKELALSRFEKSILEMDEASQEMISPKEEQTFNIR